MGPPPLVACHLRRSVEARLLATSRQSRLSRSRCRLCRRSASSLSLSLSLPPSVSFHPAALSLLSGSSFIEICSREALCLGHARVFQKVNQLGRMPVTRACRRDGGRRTQALRCLRARGPQPCRGPPASSSRLYCSRVMATTFEMSRETTSFDRPPLSRDHLCR